VIKMPRPPIERRSRYEPKWYVRPTGMGGVTEYVHTKPEALKEANKMLKQYDTVTIGRVY